MTDFAEDSAGATEAETDNQEEVGTETEEGIEAQGGEAESNDNNDDDLELYQIGELQATVNEVSSWREAYETQQSKDKDYTQKSQKNSQLNKDLTAKHEQVDERLAFFDGLESEIDDLVLGEFKDVDLAQLIDSDPAEYERTRQSMEQRHQWKDEFLEKLSAQKEARLQQNSVELFKAMDWTGNEAKQAEDSKSLSGYLKSKGVTPDEFAKVSDSWTMVAIIEAAKYQEFLAKKDVVSKQVKKAPKVTKPTQSQSAPKTLAQQMYPNMTA